MDKPSIDKFKPTSDRVLLKRQKDENRSAGGIIIPDVAQGQEPAWKAVVIATGPGRVLDSGSRVEPRVRAGDEVIVGKYSGTKIVVEGEDYYIVKEDDILMSYGA